MSSGVNSTYRDREAGSRYSGKLLVKTFRNLLLAVTALIAIVAVYRISTGGFPDYFKPVDFSTFPKGPVPQFADNIMPYGFEGNSLTPAFADVGPVGKRAICFKIDNGSNAWSGVSFNWRDIGVIPASASLYILWRGIPRGNRVLVDLTVGGGPSDTLSTSGTNYFVYLNSPPERWTTISVPLTDFKLNPHQPDTSKVIEKFDPRRISKLSFTFWPETKSSLEIASVKFAWGEGNWYPIGLIACVFLLGILLSSRTTEERVLRQTKLDFTSSAVLARVAFILVAFALFAKSLSQASSAPALSSQAIYLLFVGSILADEFLSKYLSGKVLPTLKYSVILALGWYLKVTLNPVELIFLLSIAFLPIVLYRSKLILFGLPASALFVLLSDSIIRTQSTILPGLLVISSLTLLTVFIRETLARDEAVKEAGFALSLYGEIMETTSDAIFLTDLEGKVERVNTGFELLIGYSEYEIVGKNISVVVYPDDLHLLRNLSCSSESDKRQRLTNARLVTKSGDIRSVLLREAPIIRNGNCTGHQAVATDITDRKKAEESVRELNEFNEMLIRTLPFGISIVDENGLVMFMSENLKEKLGPGMEGKKCWTVYKDDSKQCEGCPLKDGQKSGDSATMEIQGALGGRTLQVSRTGLVYKGKQAILEVFQDITESKALQARFLQAQKMESLGTLASGIAHDFNNILGIILGHASMIESRLDHSDPLSKSFATVTKAAERGASLVRQMLTFARKSNINFAPVNINDSVREMQRLFAETFPKTMQLVCNIAEDLPQINGDHNQIHQSLLNLCVNARDAMSGTGTVTISTRAVSGESLAAQFPNAIFPRYVVLEVGDNGTGMDGETLKHIFEPFFTTKEQGKGTGLGLAVVFGIMEKHDGFIDVSSQTGAGTTMYLYFPVKISAEESVTRDSAEQESAGGKETILLVEDEEMLRELAVDILTSKGYGVVTASDGEEAVHVFECNSRDVSLVLSDLGLPKLGGKEVLKRIRHLDSSIKFIVASGYLDPKEKSDLLRCGVSDIISKPYTPKCLAKTVREVLDN